MNDNRFSRRHVLSGLGALLLCSVVAHGQSLTRVHSTVPSRGQIGVVIDAPFTVRFTAPLQATSLTSASISISWQGTSIPTALQLSANRKFVTGTVTNAGGVPANASLDLVIDGGQLLDDNGIQVDANGDGSAGGVLVVAYQVGVPPVHSLLTADAAILGRVLDETGASLPGAQVDSVYYPGVEGQPALPVPSGVSDGKGQFLYRTVPFTGTEHFLVRVRKPGYSEALRQVMVLAGTCFSLGEVVLQPTTPPVLVPAATGGTLTEPMGQVTLQIPAGALQQNSNIGVTVLASHTLLRDALPPLVATEGTFVDVAGVFGEETNAPVIMRYPNQHNLPVGTRVPFGKVDHNTLVWSDLRDLYTGPLPIPNSYLGEVKNDGQGGTFVEVAFDHFCSICTGYCLPYPNPNLSPSEPPRNGLPKGPNQDCGNSIIDRREGYLFEEIPLPTFREFGNQVGISLGYASYAASPSVTLNASVNYNSTRPVERTIFEFQIEGRVMTAAYAASANNQKPEGTWIWDGFNGLGTRVPTGSYLYTGLATSLNGNTAVAVAAAFGGPATQSFPASYPGLVPLPSNTVQGRTIVVNLTDSPYGAGWSLIGEQRLHFDPDGCVILIHGNADWRRYDPDPVLPNAWISPPGDSSTLTRSTINGTYAIDWPDGSQQIFSPSGRILTTADRFGHTTSFDYSGTLITRITTPTGFVFNLGYIGGKLRQVSDSAGRLTLFTINGQGDLIAVTDATGSPRSFSYDADHHLTMQTGPRGERSTYTYQRGRVVEANVYDVGNGPLLRRRTFAPSVLQGEMGQALAAGMGTTANPIPLVSSRVDVSTDGRGGIIRHYADSAGRTVRLEDQLGRATLFTYQASGLLASRTRPDGSSTTFTYDAMGRITEVREYQPNGAFYSTSTTEYGGPFGEVSRVVDEAGKQTLFQHDFLGNVIGILDHANGMTTYTYANPALPDLPTSVMWPAGEQVTMGYDAHGNPAVVTDFPDPTLNPAGRTFTVLSDVAGRVRRTTTPLGQVRTYTYDARNRLRTITDPFLNTTTLSYGDAACACVTSNVTKITFANQTSIDYEYDGLNRLTRRIDQMGSASVYAYDAEGNRTSIINRIGQPIFFSYDAAGQLIRKELPGADITTYTYDLLGNLATAVDTACELEFTTDFLSRVTRATSQLSVALPGGQTVVLTEALNSTYDLIGNRTSLQSDSGTIHQTWTYDDLHRPQSLTVVPIPGMTFGFAYDASGKRASLTTPMGAADTAYTYDLAGQLTAISHGTLPPLGFNYPDYDAIGNTLAREITVGPVGVLSTYQYDGLSQLVQADIAFPFGNALVNQTCTYDAANRLLSDGTHTYTYDAEGRQLTRSKIGSSVIEHFVYDAEGTLRHYEEIRDVQGTPQVLVSVDYIYDPLGRRVEKRVNGIATRYLYDREDIVAELDGMGRTERLFVHGPGVDEALAFLDTVNGSVAFLHADGLGSTIATSNSSSLLTQIVLSDEFGAPIVQAFPSNLPTHLYTGREQDLETGLNFNRARYYDPFTGRFLSEDPAGPASTYNGYSYALGNPISYVDPSGEWVWVAASVGLCSAFSAGTAYLNGARGRDVWAAAAGGAVSGLIGGLAGPLGGTLAKAAGLGARGAAATALGIGIAGAGGAAGQEVTDALRCDGGTGSLGPAAGFSAAGQAIASQVPVRGLDTLKQARFFAPRTWAGLIRTPNARRLLGGIAASCAIGSLSNFF